MARNRDARSKIIEILIEGASVSFACKKIGLSRMTFYRWMKDNADFKQQVEEALELGRLQLTDIAKHSLLQLVKDKHFGAIKFVLTNNDKRYAPKYPLDPLSPSERAEYEKAKRSIVEKILADDPLITEEKVTEIVNSLMKFGFLKPPEDDGEGKAAG